LGQEEPERPNLTNLSLSAIKYLSEALYTLSEMRKKRQSEIQSIVSEIFGLLVSMGDKPSIPTMNNDVNSVSSHNIDLILYNSKEISKIPLTNEFLDALQNRKEVLIGEKMHRVKQIEDICHRISGLYERLEIPYKERENMSSAYWIGTPTKERITFLTGIFDKLEFRKKLMIREFVDKAKVELTLLQRELHIVGDTFDDYDENSLLERLESEIKKLKACREEYAKVMSLVLKRDELLDQMAELEKSSTSRDVSKYNNHTRIRQEELVRNKAKKLPETTYTLKKMIQDFESQFSILIRNKKGDPYLSIILEYESHMSSQQKARCVRTNVTSMKTDLNASKMNTTIQTTPKITPKTNRLVTKATPTPKSVTKVLFTPPTKPTKPVTRTASVLDQTTGESKSERRPFKQIKM
jgi:hypothetical protein